MTDWIGHRCADHKIDPATETLIIGTFNPDTKSNLADFFYGRSRNHLWDILPGVLNAGGSLKGKTKEEKLQFIRAKHIDFIDLIWAIGSEPPDYSDKHLDRMKEIRWREDIIDQIGKLKNLKRVCISRKGFADVPAIRNKVRVIAEYLKDRPIVFRCVHSPARGLRKARDEWKEFLTT